jgi:glycosyltransferase involved in cell wall biosynthesis
MRTLFITKETPYPPMSGVALRNWQNINIMMKYGSVGVFSFAQGKLTSEAPPGTELWHHYNLATPLSVWEQWERQAWLIRAKAHPDTDYFYRRTAAQELAKILATFAPNLAIFEEIWLYRYLKLVKRHKCRVIFDEHNIEAELFLQKHGALKMRLPRLKSIESDFIRQADLVWACSDEDALLLKNLYGQKFDPFVVPNGINVAFYDEVRLERCPPVSGLEEKNRNLIFLGTFSYPPNQVAAKLLIDKIYPRLKKIYPECRLLLVGRSPTQNMRQAAEIDRGIVVAANVPDVRPYLAAASIAIAPLLQGGGTRLKILEAFAAGCPVVSTTKGAEGLGAIDGEHLLIRDEVDELVEGICQLWSDPFLAQKLTNSAYQLVKTEYSWEAVGRSVEKSIQQLLSNKAG